MDPVSCSPRWRALAWNLFWGLTFLVSPLLAAEQPDQLEFVNGATLRGRVVAIDQARQQVQFETQIAGSKQLRHYPFDRIRSLLSNGKRMTLASAPDPTSTSQTKPRSEAEVRALIQNAGSTPPTWLASTPLEFPDTLDLSWPLPAPAPWDSQKNIGQYVWDRINPNAGRWQSGVRFMYHLLALHEKDPDLSARIKASLGSMYFRFFQDYARAAYWWEAGNSSGEDHDRVGLAECYFRLGNAALAKHLLESEYTRPAKIKLLGEMGEVNEALALADEHGPSSTQPHETYLVAGDICRLAGRFPEAIAYYEKVLDSPAARNEEYDKRYRARAQDSIDTIKRFELLEISRLANGVYRGSSLGYEAPILVEVRIVQGRITQLDIVQHREKQYYSALTDVPSQILQKQNLKDIDATSLATITAVAIINATAKALTDGAAP